MGEVFKYCTQAIDIRFIGVIDVLSGRMLIRIVIEQDDSAWFKSLFESTNNFTAVYFVNAH